MDDWERQFLLGVLGEQSQLVRAYAESVQRATADLPRPVATGLVFGCHSFMVGIQATHRLMLGCLAGEERPTLDDTLAFLTNESGTTYHETFQGSVEPLGHVTLTLVRSGS